MSEITTSFIILGLVGVTLFLAVKFVYRVVSPPVDPCDVPISQDSLKCLLRRVDQERHQDPNRQS